MYVCHFGKSRWKSYIAVTTRSSDSTPTTVLTYMALLKPFYNAPIAELQQRLE